MTKKRRATTYPTAQSGLRIPTKPPEPGTGTYTPQAPYAVGASLHIELVPRPLWGVSAYRLLRGSRWTAIRRQVLNEAEHACSDCGSSQAPLTCHEEWLYDDHSALATLHRFAIHCAACDLATHMGRAAARGLKAAAMRQFCAVRGCGRAAAERMLADAMTIFRGRSGKAWTLAVSPALLTKYPALAVLEGRAVPAPTPRTQSER